MAGLKLPAARCQSAINVLFQTRNLAGFLLLRYLKGAVLTRRRFTLQIKRTNKLCAGHRGRMKRLLSSVGMKSTNFLTGEETMLAPPTPNFLMHTCCYFTGPPLHTAGHAANKLPLYLHVLQISCTLGWQTLMIMTSVFGRFYQLRLPQELRLKIVVWVNYMPRCFCSLYHKKQHVFVH